MFKNNIRRIYPRRFENYRQTNNSIFIADYTLQTNSRKKVRVSQTKPNDIQSFSLSNNKNLPIGYIVFGNSSFNCYSVITKLYHVILIHN